MEFDSHDKKIFPLKLETEDGIKNSKDEMINLIMEIDKARTNYFQNRLLLKSIKQAACENNLEILQIVPKVHQIIRAESISNFNLEGKNEEPLNILGLTDRHKNSSISLSYCEKQKFNSVVEEKLLSNCFKFKKLEWKKANETPDKVINARDIFSSEKMELLKSADHQFIKMYENLSLYRNLIKELIEMRQGLLGMVRSNMLQLYETKCECLELEAKILECQILTEMFSENSSMPEVAKRICDASQKEYDERKSELEKLRRNEEAYNDLDGTEYDDILKKYKKYKRHLDCIDWVVTELH